MFFLKPGALTLLFALLFYSHISSASICNISLDKFSDGAISMVGKPRPQVTFDSLNHSQRFGKKLKYGIVDSFEGINFFISKGAAPFLIKNYLFDSMMFRSPVEPFSLYPNIVKISEIAEDRKYVVFEILDHAVFNHGDPVLAKDILYTFDFLKKHGRYNYQIGYKHVRAEKISHKKVKFHILNGNKELPLILGLMPVLSHKNQLNTLKKQGKHFLLGVSPYKIDKINLGKNIILKKDTAYFNRKKSLSCLRFPFNQVHITFFKNEQSAFEATKSGDSDFFYENNITRLNKAYDFPALKSGEYQVHKIRKPYPSGLYGFIFNTRRTLFQDVTLRKAMRDIFDFEVFNKYFLYDSDQQIENIFLHHYSEKNSHNFIPYRDKVRKIIKDLKNKGYSFQKGKLLTPNKKPVVLNILMRDTYEVKYALFLQEMLKNIGVKAHIETVDSALYQKRIHKYDYDMILDSRYISNSPGLEQRNYWGCGGRQIHGTRNYSGICHSVIEKKLNDIDQSLSYEELNKAMNKINEVLFQEAYFIPLQTRGYYHILARRNIQPSAYGAEYFRLPEKNRK